ncbi:hypothetical protein [Thaumasiovibrio sp. DFM-14]|uniref:hypothetical protein n=1 Tax=Thaumasiovibrio sp. DFM-14 TaxID=3384792 RepID=UPI00399F244A
MICTDRNKAIIDNIAEKHRLEREEFEALGGSVKELLYVQREELRDELQQFSASEQTSCLNYYEEITFAYYEQADLSGVTWNKLLVYLGLISCIVTFYFAVHR